MPDRPTDAWERRLREEALAFAYPPTPDVAGAVRRRLSEPERTRPVARRLALATLALVALVAAALAVPGVRAAVREFFQIGAIRLRVSDAPLPAPGPPLALEHLGAPVTLTEATARVPFPVRLPGASSGLGPPEAVYLLDPGVAGTASQAVVLIWFDPAFETPAVSLYAIGPPYFGIKAAARDSLAQAMVGEREAFWVPGPHPLQLAGMDDGEWALVPGNVLIWTDGDLTYRLESGGSMEDALRIARSLE